MSVVEDIHQVIHDLVAPQLKSLDTKLTALDASVTQRFASVEALAAARNNALVAQIAQLANTVASNQANVNLKLDLDRRIDRIEQAQREQATRKISGSSYRRGMRSPECPRMPSSGTGSAASSGKRE